MLPRQANVSLLYNGANASGQIAPYLASFQYTDVASGSSDKISIQINDRDHKWIGAWFPQKGDLLQPTIQTFNWWADGQNSRFPCGTFRVDDFSFAGGPIRLSLDAVAVPADNSGFKATKRTETYEKTTLQEIGQAIADRSGISLFFDANDIAIQKVEQNNQNDCEFYCGLVEKFGLALKIYNSRIVVFSEGIYEAKKAKAVLTPADFEPGWSWNTQTTGTYTGVKYQYTNSDKNKTFTVTAGGGDRILECNEPADNLTEATAIALAALNKANRGMTTMSITMMAMPGLIASDCVEIRGLKRLSGKYFIEQITHSLGSGYKMALELRLVEPLITEASSISCDFEKEKQGSQSGGSSGGGSGSTGPSTPSAPAGLPKKGELYTVTSDKMGYYTAAEAAAGSPLPGHPTGMCHPGTYWVFNVSGGMLNLSTVKTVPGNWINPG